MKPRKKFVLISVVVTSGNDVNNTATKTSSLVVYYDLFLTLSTSNRVYVCCLKKQQLPSCAHFLPDTVNRLLTARLLMVAATQTAEDDDEQMGPPSGEQNEESASHHEQIRSDLEWPTNDLFSSMTYSYMSRILEKGRKQFKNGDPLRTDDLFRVPDDMKADTLVSAFW